MTEKKLPPRSMAKPGGRSIGEIAAAFGLPFEHVLDAAHSIGIGVVGADSRVAIGQESRLVTALHARPPGQANTTPGEPATCDLGTGQDALTFSWDWTKFSLNARNIVPNLDAMRAVERVAVAEKAVCWISRRGESSALVVLLESLAVVVGHDIVHGRPAFVITAYDSSKPRYSDQRADFMRGADSVTGVVPIESRLALLKVRA